MNQMWFVFVLMLALTIPNVDCKRFHSKADLKTLISLFVVHRHGDRTIISTFPKDKYINESYWPDGWGELTEKGKARMFNVGRFLRARYDGFLTDNIREVLVRSSGIERCLESTQLVLNGMYNPKGRWVWNSNQRWQPFPVHTTEPRLDSMLNPDSHCLAAEEESKKILNSDYVQKLNQENQNLLSFLSEKCGEQLADIFAAEYVFDSLKIEYLNNYTWPEWVNDTIYQQLSDIADQTFYIEFMTRAAQRFRTGVFFADFQNRVRKSINHLKQQFKASVYNSFSNDAWKKVFVYSSHDSFVSAVLNALGVFNDLAPPFGATIIFELHQPATWKYSNYQPFIRTYYLNETESHTLHPLHIPACHFQLDCPVDSFLEGINDLIIDNWHLECKIHKENLNINVMPSQMDMDSEVITLTLIGIAVTVLVLMIILVCLFLRPRRASYVYQLLPTL